MSLAIRRARRSGAKRIDLAHRGLRSWPEALFDLGQLQAIDLSGNYLTQVDESISKLQALEELDLSSNKIENVSALSFTGLPSLRSVVLEGNPVTSQLGLEKVRQLAHPPRHPGQSPSQVLQSLLASVAQSRSAESAILQRPPAAHETQVQGFDSDDDIGPADLRPPSVARPPVEVAADAQKVLSHEVDAPRKSEQTAMLTEMEKLRSRVRELEDQQKSGGGSGSSGAMGDDKPDWLKQGSRSNLSMTLPSRRASTDMGEEAADLKNQLREEQRRAKRLEKEVQRLQERMSEKNMSGGSGGASPHFELEDVAQGEQISQGGFSVVFKGVWNHTKVAVKKIFDPKIDDELLAEFDNEVRKLEQLRHPNILLLLAVHRKPPALSMLTELVEGGTLFQLLHSPSKFNSASGPITAASSRETMEIMDATAVALTFLHARSIVHRDVKPHNVLLSPNLDVKLCDFGLSRMRSELMTGTMQFAGTPNYMAPEIFRQEKYSEKVDVFAFGTMLWEATEVDIPFANMDGGDIRDMVLRGKMPQISGSTPSAARALIQACWLEQVARPAMAEVLGRLRDVASEGGRPRRPRTAPGAQSPSTTMTS